MFNYIKVDFSVKKKVTTSISDNNQSKKVVVNRIYLTNLCKIPTLNYFETPFYIKIDIPMNKYFFLKILQRDTILYTAGV